MHALSFGFPPIVFNSLRFAGLVVVEGCSCAVSLEILANAAFFFSTFVWSNVSCCSFFLFSSSTQRSSISFSRARRALSTSSVVFDSVFTVAAVSDGEPSQNFPALPHSCASRDSLHPGHRGILFCSFDISNGRVEELNWCEAIVRAASNCKCKESRVSRWFSILYVAMLYT